jgi:HD-GYP domain-containing protein (c-di-GMP phosphodiesterase class II)
MKIRSLSLRQVFPVNETLTPIIRQEMTLRSCLIFTEVLLAVLTAVNINTWQQQVNTSFLFNVYNDVLGILLFAAIYLLNKKHFTKLASILYLCLAFYISFTAYPIRHSDQIFFYLALPTLIASLITRKEGSIIMAVLGILCATVYKLVNFPGELYPHFTAVSLLMIGIVSSRVTDILNQVLNQMSEAYDKTIEGWSKALEMRNQETEGHSTRVVDLTLKLAQYMKVDSRKISSIRRGVLLHDIGKIAVPDSILCKTGPLTSSEFTVMHKHPEYAYNMLKDISYLAEALQIPYCHHEKWDGTGYPRGLKGTEIPLEARIFSVVDVWDAMRSDRSYRKAIPENQVIEYLRCEKGRSFDPIVINAFFKMMKFKSPEKQRARMMFQEAESVHEIV